MSNQTAAEKYAKELKVVDNIAFNLVLPDAVAESTGYGTTSARVGFGKTDTGTISFAIDAETAQAQEGSYRNSAEAHATHFAEAFNSSLVGTNAQGQAIPLTEHNIATVEGNVVHFDLHGLRKLLAEHTIADQLPQISKQYSVQYQVEQASKQAPYVVESALQEKRALQQQEAIKDKVLEACKEELENPGHLEKLAEKNPELAQLAQGTLQQAEAVNAALEEKPGLLLQIRGKDEAFAELIELVGEKQKEKGASQKQPAGQDKAGEQGRFAQLVEERRKTEDQAQQR